MQSQQEEKKEREGRQNLPPVFSGVCSWECVCVGGSAKAD